MPDRSAESLCGFVECAVVPGTSLVTDDWSGYASLAKRGYKHLAIAERGEPQVAEEYLPIIHLVFANLETWLNGIHHGVSHQHLQAYLNEFTFRFNRRFYPFNAFRSLLGIAGDITAPTYASFGVHQRGHGRGAGPLGHAARTAATRRTGSVLMPLGAEGFAVVLIIIGATPGGLVQPNEARIRDVGGVLFDSAEDEIATVEAGQRYSTPELWVAGTSMTLLTVDAKLMPVLPLIARPDSTDALVVAFGMGTAFRTALIAGLQTDVVELVPSVPKMFGYTTPTTQRCWQIPTGG